uniref:ANK_REP_REGION domain-containing protein n=1 Tax=Mesocestoides corti TaxID=53468 RepID=A0A5K3EXW5_MESCO
MASPSLQPGHIMTQIVLLQWGANPDATNLKSDTALLRAIRRGHVPNVLLLLAYGANPIPCSSVRSTHFLLPLQLARHLCQQEMQNALINTNRNFDTYLTNLVRSSLPVGTFLVDPGHPTSMQSITPRSLSFIPVQIISNTNVTAPLQLTFNTPPHYSEYFSSFGEGLALDELILLYVACVDLQDGLVIPPRSKQATPVYTCAYFNGSRTPCPDLSLLKNYATSSISPSSPIDVDESPGFRVFVLGSRLNKGGLNSLSLETPAKRDQTRSKVHGPTHETDQESSLFEKLLFGIYRVRIGMGALSDAAVLQTDFCPEEPTVKIFSEH